MLITSNAALPRLISTPPVVPGELQRGYLLRLVEKNGYDSLTTLTSLAGIGGNAARATVVPIAPMVPFLYRNDDQIRRLRQAFTNGCPVPAAPYLDIKAAKLCPACVSEQGYLQQFWGLAYAEACPVHRCRVLTHCPSCARKLSWARSGLTVCRCGYDFAGDHGGTVSEAAILDLLHLVYARTQGAPIDVQRLQTSGFPVKPLLALDLDSLLKLIKKLAGQVQRPPGSQEPHWQSLRVAARALSDWPHGFHAYLEHIAGQRAVAPPLLGLRAQHSQVYSALFKARFPKGAVDFLLREVCAWGGGTTPARLHPRHRAHLRSVPHYIGVTEAADHIGVRVPTVKTLIELGILSALRGQNGRTWLVDNSRGLPKKDAKCASLNARKAARWLGVPQSVLLALRRQRTFETTLIPERSSSFSLQDLEVFRGRVWRLARPSNVSSTAAVSVATLMRRKQGGPEHRVALFEALLTGELVAYRGEGSGLGALQLDAAAVESFFLGQPLVRDWLTPHEAAKAIGCDPLVINALIDYGLINARQSGRRQEISRKSVEFFRQHYLPLAVLARKAGTSSQKLQRYCQDHRIALLEVPRRGRSSSQALIPVTDVMRLEPLIGVPLLRAWLDVEPLTQSDTGACAA